MNCICCLCIISVCAWSRYTTELVAVPRLSSSGGFPDVVVGAPMPYDEPYATILLIQSATRAATTLPGARGLGSFKSMAFTADGTTLFAVDEQPAIWRWTRDNAFLSFQLTDVARNVHPMQNSIWKLMIWTNSRLVVATDYSLNMWTQCSPCPAGTVTANASSAQPISERCLCPAGTFNQLYDFRSTCTPCTAAATTRGGCAGGSYRTLANPVCNTVGFQYDEGCKACKTQGVCQPSTSLTRPTNAQAILPTTRASAGPAPTHVALAVSCPLTAPKGRPRRPANFASSTVVLAATRLLHAPCGTISGVQRAIQPVQQASL